MNSPGTESKFVDVCLILVPSPALIYVHCRRGDRFDLSDGRVQRGRNTPGICRRRPRGGKPEPEPEPELRGSLGHVECVRGRRIRRARRQRGVGRIPCLAGSSPRGAEGKEDPQPRPRRLENSSSSNSSSNSKRPCTFPSITSEDPPDLPPRPRRRRPCRGSRNTSTSTSTSRGHIRGVRASTNISSRRWGWEEEARAPTGDRTTTPRVRSPQRRRSSSSSSIACLRSTGAALVPKARCPRPPSTRSTPTSSSSTLRPLRARAPPRTRFTVRTVGRG